MDFKNSDSFRTGSAYIDEGHSFSQIRGEQLLHVDYGDAGGQVQVERWYGEAIGQEITENVGNHGTETFEFVEFDHDFQVFLTLHPSLDGHRSGR